MDVDKQIDATASEITAFLDSGMILEAAYESLYLLTTLAQMHPLDIDRALLQRVSSFTLALLGLAVDRNT